MKLPGASGRRIEILNGEADLQTFIGNSCGVWNAEFGFLPEFQLTGGLRYCVCRASRRTAEKMIALRSSL